MAAVCCAAEPCPLGMLLSLKRHGSRGGACTGRAVATPGGACGQALRRWWSHAGSVPARLRLQPEASRSSPSSERVPMSKSLLTSLALFLVFAASAHAARCAGPPPTTSSRWTRTLAGPTAPTPSAPDIYEGLTRPSKDHRPEPSLWACHQVGPTFSPTQVRFTSCAASGASSSMTWDALHGGTM